jgi:hypothetical protein
LYKGKRLDCPGQRERERERKRERDIKREKEGRDRGWLAWVPAFRWAAERERGQVKSWPSLDRKLETFGCNREREREREGEREGEKERERLLDLYAAVGWTTDLAKQGKKEGMELKIWERQKLYPNFIFQENRM